MYGEAKSKKERLTAALLSVAATGCFGIGLIMGFAIDHGGDSGFAPERTLTFSLENTKQPDGHSKPEKRIVLRQVARSIDGGTAMATPTAREAGPAAAPTGNAAGERIASPDQAGAGQSSALSSANDKGLPDGGPDKGKAGEEPSRLRSEASASDGRVDDNYATQVYRKVASRIQQTASLRDKRIYGTARIRLVIDVNGRLIDASLAGSSGNAELDKVALAQARSAAPFPRRPKMSSWTQRSFVIPMTYRPRTR